MGIRHTKVSTAPDDADESSVSPSDWNADHTGHDKALHDALAIDHTSLTNKGTNSHAQLDAHLSSTSNPHSVTGLQVLPSLTGNSGRYLTNDGTNVAWGTVSGGSSLPSMTGNSGKFLTNDGTNPSWAAISNNIPSLTGNSGRYLTNDGTNLSWATPTGILPNQSGNAGRYLATNGTSAYWAALTGSLAALGTNMAAASGVDSTGATDSSTAIANAIGTSIAPKTIYFPPGTYMMRNVPLPSNTTVVAWGAKFIAPASAGADFFFQVVGSSGDKKRNVFIFGGEYAGTKSGTATMGGVNIDWGISIKVSGGIFWDMGRNAIAMMNTLDGRIENVSISNCTLDRAGAINITAACDRCSVVGCYIDTVYNDGILVYQEADGVQPKNITIDRVTINNYSTISASTDHQGRAAIHLYRAKDVNVTNCIVTGGNGDAEGIRYRNTRGGVVSGNYVYDCGGGAIAAVRITTASSTETETDVGDLLVMSNRLQRVIVGVRYAYNAATTPVTYPMVYHSNIVRDWTSRTPVGAYAAITPAAFEVLASGSVNGGNNITSST